MQAFKEKGWGYNATGVRQCDSAEITKNNGLMWLNLFLKFITFNFMHRTQRLLLFKHSL